MAPLPANTTGRVFYDYVTGNEPTSQEHTVAFRYAASVDTPAFMDGRFLAILNALGAGQFRNQWRVIRARVQLAGSSFSTPYILGPALSAFRGSNTGVAYVPSWEAIEDTFQSRSPSTGRRGDFSLYRAGGTVDDTFRYGMPAPVISAISEALTAGFLATIDGSIPVFYTYINQNYNSYWERELRS